MGGIFGGSESSLPAPKKEKMKKIAVNGVPPGAKISVGTDGPDAPGAGDSESKPASGPTAKSGTAKDPNQRRGGHPTELGAGQGRSLLGPDTGQTKDVADKLGDTGRHVFSIEDDKPRGGFGPSGSIDSGDRKTSAPDKGPKGGGSGDDGHERLKEQINNIRERQEKQQKQQEEKERQDRLAKMEALKAERKAAKGTFGRNIYEQMRGKAPAKSPGPSGSTDSGDRRPNLLDPTSKPPSSGLLNMDALKDIKPARQSLLTPTSTRHARALANIERQRGYYPGSQGNTGTGDTDPSRALNMDALKDIKAFDKVQGKLSEPRSPTNPNGPSPNPYENVSRPTPPSKVEEDRKSLPEDVDMKTIMEWAEEIVADIVNSAKKDLTDEDVKKAGDEAFGNTINNEPPFGDKDDPPPSAPAPSTFQPPANQKELAGVMAVLAAVAAILGSFPQVKALSTMPPIDPNNPLGLKPGSPDA